MSSIIEVDAQRPQGRAGEWVGVMHLRPAPAVGDSYFVKFPDGQRAIAQYVQSREFLTESFWLCGQGWITPGYGRPAVLFWSEKIKIPFAGPRVGSQKKRAARLARTASDLNKDNMPGNDFRRLVSLAGRRADEELQEDLKYLTRLLALTGSEFVDLRRRAIWGVLAGRRVEPCRLLDGSKNPKYSNAQASAGGPRCG